MFSWLVGWRYYVENGIKNIGQLVNEESAALAGLI